MEGGREEMTVEINEKTERWRRDEAGSYNRWRVRGEG